MATIDYVPGSVEPTDFSDLPAGDYPAVILDSEVKQTKDGLGRYLNLTLTIIEGSGKGRKVFDRLNLWNANSTAVLIAQQTLESICRALNIAHQVRDSAEFHNKPLVIRLGYDERDRQGLPIQEGRRNSVKVYKPYANVQPYQPQAQQQQTWSQPPLQQQPAWNQPPVQQQQTWNQPAQPPIQQGNINQPPPWEK
mgnify:CR=1 FL=1